MLVVPRDHYKANVCIVLWTRNENIHLSVGSDLPESKWNHSGGQQSVGQSLFHSLVAGRAISRTYESVRRDTFSKWLGLRRLIS